MNTSATNQKYFYPVTPATMHRYAESIFTPIKQGECVSTVWVPMAGRRMWNKFIIENIALFKNELPDYDKYLLVYVEPLDLTEESLTGYLKLMGKALIEVCEQKGCGTNGTKKAIDDEMAYSKLLDIVKETLKEITEKGFKVVFFLGEFDELTFANQVFYNNLKSLWQTLNPDVLFIFLTIRDMAEKEMTDKLGELNAATLQNIVYIPVRGSDDENYLIDYFVGKQLVTITDSDREVLRSVCGGNPYLFRVAIKIMASKDCQGNLRECLLGHYEMLSVSRKLFELRTANEKRIIADISAGVDVGNDDDLTRLLKLGLVVGTSGKYEVVGELMRLVANGVLGPGVTTSKQNGSLFIDDNTGAICFKGNSVEEKFTRQEYDLILALLKEKAVLKTRDQIGNILWGDEAYEKYSDWAIDQIASKIRKKFESLDTTTRLLTIKGKGYKITEG